MYRIGFIFMPATILQEYVNVFLFQILISVDDLLQRHTLHHRIILSN